MVFKTARSRLETKALQNVVAVVARTVPSYSYKGTVTVPSHPKRFLKVAHIDTITSKSSSGG